MPKGSGEFVPPEKKCKATAKHTGEQCGQFRVPGKEVCHYHGGKTPGGIASKHLKHGRYSKWMPQRLMEQYERSLSDDKALVQREEIALAESRKTDLLKRADTGESGALMKELRGLIRAYRAAARKLTRIPDTKENAKQRAIHQEEMGDALASIFSKIEHTDDDYRVWAEIQKVDNLLIRLRESERRHIQEQHEMYSVDEVRTMLVAVADIIKRQVRDQLVIQAVAQELAQLENVSTGRVEPKPPVNELSGRDELEALTLGPGTTLIER